MNTNSDIVDLIVKLTLLIGAVWAIYKVKKYRENKQRIQMEIDANIYKLTSPENVESYTWNKKGERISIKQEHTHAVEILINFTNKGFVRMRLYNIQVGINTMREIDSVQFDENDGHLHLTNIYTSGNIVPKFPVKHKPLNETSFYYIEPGVTQTISYLELIKQPRELIQIYAKFSLEQKRIFPEKDIGEKKVFPHTAAKTFQIDKNGFPIKSQAELVV